MNFYNPFLPPPMPFGSLQPNKAGTNSSLQPNRAGTDGSLQQNRAGTDGSLQPNRAGTDGSLQPNRAGTDGENDEKKDKKNYKKSPNLGLFYNYFQETDNIIILGLLFFLYSQNSHKSPLSIILLMLLFDL